MKQREFLIISFTVFLTIIAWIIADLYHITQTEQVVREREGIVNLDAIEIDIKTLQLLEKRQ